MSSASSRKSLVEGTVQNCTFVPETDHGAFVREPRSFRQRVTADGASGFLAEPGRYHLYVSYGCPWAHRTLIVRALKGLEAVVPVSVVEPVIGPQGWAFGDAGQGTHDALYGRAFLHEFYREAAPDFTGIVTVPVLWDSRQRTIVNNESADIIGMFNEAFDAWGRADVQLRPPALLADIDALNDWLYDHVNNAVYEAGFAASQTAYEQAVDKLFAALDTLEQRLASQPFLLGQTPCEPDWRLFPTLVRFDAAYHGLFKCNLRRLIDYTHLPAYVRRLYQVPGVAATVRLDHIKRLYYGLTVLNPSGIVPKGPSGIWR